MAELKSGQAGRNLKKKINIIQTEKRPGTCQAAAQSGGHCHNDLSHPLPALAAVRRAAVESCNGRVSMSVSSLRLTLTSRMTE